MSKDYLKILVMEYQNLNYIYNLNKNYQKKLQQLLLLE